MRYQSFRPLNLPKSKFVAPLTRQNKKGRARVPFPKNESNDRGSGRRPPFPVPDLQKLGTADRPRLYIFHKLVLRV